MNNFAGSTGSWRLWLVMLWMGGNSAVCWAGLHDSPTAEAYDYSQPPLLTGTLYSIHADPRQVLFTFRRAATRDGATVNVVRQFKQPDGSTDAVETIVYKSGQLASYELTDLKAGLWGLIQIYPDPNHPDRRKMFIDHGHVGEVKSGGSTCDLPEDTVIDDSLYPFAMAHWADLTHGKTVKFHFVSLEHEKAYGFKLVKDRESVADGRAVVWIKMEPTSFLLARFIDPIYLAIEKDGPHRPLEYTGRTVPRIKKDGSWKYLDAETVLNWK